jgi:hypothetical protein
LKKKATTPVRKNYGKTLRILIVIKTRLFPSFDIFNFTLAPIRQEARTAKKQQKMECQNQLSQPQSNVSVGSKKSSAAGSNGLKNGKCSFKILNKIGQGGYGYVFTVEKTSGPDANTIYAMKVGFV